LPLSEDFARWADDPMTRRFMAVLKAWEEKNRKDWEVSAFNDAWGQADRLQKELHAAQARVSAFNQARRMNFADIAYWLGIEDAE
jgi:hypothetical protein